MQTPTEVDRVAPTLKPDGLPVLRQEWHHLLFLHWEVSVETLRPLVPPQLTIDTFNGKAYVGLIAFTIAASRATGMPEIPWLSSFHEVNVRTYVHLDGRDPGVWFFSLDASSRLAVRAARAIYHLPYFHARIAMMIRDDGTIDYSSHRERGPAACTLLYRPDGVPSAASFGTIESFLLERYILYSASNGRLYRARVHHAPYPAQRATFDLQEETLIWAAGIKRSEASPLAHYARRVDVKIYRPEVVDLRAP